MMLRRSVHPHHPSFNPDPYCQPSMTASTPVPPNQPSSGNRPALAREDLSALILAGGTATRFGGQDKGLASLLGRPLIEYILPRLEPHVAYLLISANRNRDVYRRYAPVVLPDAPDLPEAGGPLVGVTTGLRAAPTPWVVVVPCDTPALPADLVARLAAAVASAPGKRLAVATTHERRHATCMLLHRSLAVELTEALADGERQVRRWQDSVGAIEVPFEDPSRFENLNSPEDFQHFAASYASQQENG